MTDDIERQVVRTLQPLRVPMLADGADLELLSVHDGVVRVRLVLGEETCSDCVLPADLLRSVLLAGLADQIPSVTEVELVDPRTRPHPAR